MSSGVLKKLKGGDRRSIGRSEEVVREVLAKPELFAELFSGMLSSDPLVRMRSADAVEKITVNHPEYLAPFKTTLIRKVARSDQQEVRWHAAQMFSRLKLNANGRKEVLAILNDYLEDRSSIVRTFAMQALADLALADAKLRPSVVKKLEALTASGTPAMKSRGEKLLARLRS